MKTNIITTFQRERDRDFKWENWEIDLKNISARSFKMIFFFTTIWNFESSQENYAYYMNV